MIWSTRYIPFRLRVCGGRFCDLQNTLSDEAESKVRVTIILIHEITNELMVKFNSSFALAAVGDKSGKSGLVPKHHFAGGDHRAEGMTAAAANSLMANERLHQGANTRPL